MGALNNKLQHYFGRFILGHPAITLILLALVVVFFAWHTPQFRLDASSDSLLLENDQSLQYYRAIKARYGSDDYLVITYTPVQDLFSKVVLDDLRILHDRFTAIKRVESVTSILNVPLINSPPVTIAELEVHIPTLMDESSDPSLAKEEFLTSPLYSNLLLSADGRTTALLVNFRRAETWHTLLSERDVLREKALERPLNKQEEYALVKAEHKFESFSAETLDQQQEDIAHVRAIIRQHEEDATLFLGGVPMITADSINFVRSDLKTFGIAVLCFVVALLTLIFRSFVWVAIPMMVCFCVGVTIVGFLGFMNWPVTVVSSNFISLLLIFTLSFSVHQIVCYREHQAEHPKASQHTLVQASTLKIIVPCFYMVVTTIVAFGSLVVSDIRPVIDFGWMMAFGLGIAFIIAFTLFPAILMFLNPPEPVTASDFTEKITSFFARTIEGYRTPILMAFLTVVLFSIWGLQYLTVENRFIDYFKESTEIHQGMKVIDRDLGGTTPLDIVIDAPKVVSEPLEDDFMLFSDTDPIYSNELAGPSIANGYWFNSWMLEDIEAIHNYLDKLPETGKVISFHTAIEMLRDLDDEAVMDSMYMAVLYKKIPQGVKDTLITPYLSSDGNQLRFSLRVFESDYSLNRQHLIEKINNDLTTKFGLTQDQVHITGMLRLYNNVLQSLFASQIKTIWVVFVSIFVMFSILFRSMWVAAVAFLPNVTITVLVLGIMGWLRIPLDIMTITIAAICTGTADDNTIHYVHRMKLEYKSRADYWEAVRHSHNTIGRAMYYTSITIMLGFSILGFSNFVPTIYFGLLTAFAMMVALLANLALLPLLMVTLKPFGKKK
jgi:uncharacterized protein